MHLQGLAGATVGSEENAMTRSTGSRAHARWRRAAAVSLAFLLISDSSAIAHETGSVTLNAKELQVGGNLIVRGSKMTKGASFRVELRGILQTFSFGRVSADSGGRFELSVALPAAAGPGAYTVAAVAADGDVSAQANLMIVATTATVTGTGGAHAMESMPGMPDMGGATAEYMHVSVTTTSGEWIVIALIILVSVLGGVLLLVRRGSEAMPVS